MEPRKLKIDILPNPFLKADGTFDKTEAFKLAGKIAGVCYSEEGFANLLGEKEEKTMRRVAMTLNNGHHSVYDHIGISFNLQNIPKLLAMVLNNEHQYTTSEKSARYTLFGQEKDSVITNLDTSLYQKWLEILRIKIKEQYGNVFSDSKIEKLALETARNFLPSLITMENGYWRYFGVQSIILMTLPIFLRNRKKYYPFFLMFCLLFIPLLFSQVGSIFMGFSYPNSRWSYAVAFCFCFG